MAKERIPITTIDSTYSDGDILYGYDVNRIIDVFREAANANKLDINKLLTGSNYQYIAEDLSGLQQLASELIPLDGQNGFIFDGNNTAQHLELYSYNGTSGAWDYVADLSLLNPYTESVTINGKLINWNEVDGAMQIAMNNEVTLQIGQEQLFYGKAQGDITNGDPVMFAGVQGNHFLLQVATPIALNANPEYFIGVATQNILNGEFGYVAEFGFARDIDLPEETYAPGDVLWFDSTNGGWTTEKPIQGKAQIRAAVVIKTNQNQNQAFTGTIFVRISILEGTGNTVFYDDNLPPRNERFQGMTWFDESDTSIGSWVLPTVYWNVQVLNAVVFNVYRSLTDSYGAYKGATKLEILDMGMNVRYQNTNIALINQSAFTINDNLLAYGLVNYGMYLLRMTFEYYNQDDILVQDVRLAQFQYIIS